MHYIKQSSRSRALALGAVTHLFVVLSLGVLLVLLINIIVKGTEQSMILFGGVVLVSIALWVLRWIVSTRCRCQLCQNNVMQSLKCERHRNAHKLLGSYRTRIACSIIFTGTYRCSYCGESFSLRKKDAPAVDPVPAVPRRQNVTRRAGKIPQKRG